MPNAPAVTLPVLPEIGRAPAKPEMWESCNGCGVCCAAYPCQVARDFLDAPEGLPCPALEFREGRYWCGLAGILAGQARRAFDLVMGIGLGCDSDAPAGSLTYRDERGDTRPWYPPPALSRVSAPPHPDKNGATTPKGVAS